MVHVCRIIMCFVRCVMSTCIVQVFDEALSRDGHNRVKKWNNSVWNSIRSVGEQILFNASPSPLTSI